MKKVNLLLAASVIALGSVFTSCSDSENAVPEITFTAGAGATIEGESITGVSSTELTYTVAAEAEIKTLNVGFAGALTAVAAAEGEATYTGKVTIDASKGVFTVKVVDKDGNELTKTISIKSTALAAATDFTLVYSKAGQTDGKNKNATVGITYTGQTGTSPNWDANFAVTSTEKNIVILTKAEYDAISSQEGLAAAYTAKATSAVASFKTAAEPVFVPAYFVIKTNSVYYLVELKSVLLATENNQAIFSYKK